MTSTVTNQAPTGVRAEKLVGRFAELNVDALLVTGGANRRYLCGFTGSAGALLITPQRRTLFTDFRYTQQASRQVSGFDVVETPDILDGVIEQMGKSSPARFGFEAEHTSYAAFQRLGERLGELDPAPELVPLDGVVERQRSIKDIVELEAMREAVRIADEVMALAPDCLRPGVSEAHVADLLQFEMRRLGADEPSFDIIVAAGPNGAMAHHRPGPREFADGDPVVVDLGVRVDGYCSDITRSFCVGESDRRFRAIYQIVRDALRAAEDAIRAGLTGVQADALARDRISEAGYGDNFGHGTGHGVGLEIHEAPRLSARSDDVLRAGMVTSVEPGIYIPDWGGVRIEDLLLIQETGAEVLTRAAK